MDAKAVFNNQDAERVLVDYNQFQTKILSSARSGGKTYLVQDRKILHNYFKHHKYFAYLREAQNELEDTLRSGFWDTHLTCTGEYAKHSYRVDGNRIIIDGEVAGVAYALTTYCRIRGTQGGVGTKISRAEEKELEKQIETVEQFSSDAPIDSLCLAYFDEFEPLVPQMGGQARFEAYLHSVDTLFRFRHNVEAVLSGNLYNCNNPFLFNLGFGDLKYLTCGIKKSYTAEPNKAGKIQPLAVWAHIEGSDAWKQERDESYVGKIVRGKDFGGMFTNGGVQTGNNFKKIDGKPLPRFILYNLTDGVNDLTYWKTRAGVYYLTARTKNVTFPTFAFNLKLTGAGVRILPDAYRRELLKNLEAGRIQFDNARSFELFINMIPNTRSVKSL